MIRLLSAGLSLALAAPVGLSQTPIPKSMPGNAAPKTAPQTAPAQPAPKSSSLPTMPTVSQEMVAEACSIEGGECCEGGRCGILCRLASRWSGHRYAYVDSVQCCPTTTTAPACSNYEEVSVSCDDPCRRFGLGRFLCRDRGERCRPGLFARFKAFICYHPTPSHMPCMPNPYRAPARAYFGPSAESPAGCNGCTTSQCTIDTCNAMPVHCGGRVGSGVGGGLPLGNSMGSADLGSGALGNGILGGRAGHVHWKDTGRLHTDAGGKVIPHHHHPRPGCWELAGTPLVNNTRFAGNQRPTPPAINAGKPYDFKGSSHNLQYMKGEEVVPREQTAAK